MSVQIQILLNGITYASLLFVIATGFTLIFGLLRVVNLSHGVFYILGAYVGYSTQQATGSWLVAVAVGTAAVGAAAAIVHILVKRVKGDLPQTLLTLGIAIMIGDLCLWLWGGLPVTLNSPDVLRTVVEIGETMYPGYRLFVLAVAIVLGVGLSLFFYRSKVGAMIRAGVDNRDMVSALGININRLFTRVFILGGLLTGLSGTLGGSYLAFGPSTDFQILTYALVVVIIGGMGSIPGSAVGALLVGLIDSYGRTYFSELSIFLLSGTVILVLAFRPQGLFGRKERTA